LRQTRKQIRGRLEIQRFALVGRPHSRTGGGPQCRARSPAPWRARH
jgi:hypothetical protein